MDKYTEWQLSVLFSFFSECWLCEYWMCNGQMHEVNCHSICYHLVWLTNFIWVTLLVFGHLILIYFVYRVACRGSAVFVSVIKYTGLVEVLFLTQVISYSGLQQMHMVVIKFSHYFFPSNMYLHSSWPLWKPQTETHWSDNKSNLLPATSVP